MTFIGDGATCQQAHSSQLVCNSFDVSNGEFFLKKKGI
jgi:hypothetical protein